MKKMFGILLGLLFCSMGMAQETPPEPTSPSQSVTQTKRASKFQGLWQQRKGHSVCLDYSFQADLLEYSLYKNLKYTPIRFDLSYQYDIPWNPKRINFYAHAGLAYRQLRIKNIDDLFPYYESYYDGPLAILKSFEEGVAVYAGIGLKIHCTDWLHLSFSEALSVMPEWGYGRYIGEGEHLAIWPGWKHTLVGFQSSFHIVGQIKRFSVYIGYRLDHWLKTFPNHYAPPLECSPLNKAKNGKDEAYLTIGLGYTF